MFPKPGPFSRRGDVPDGDSPSFSLNTQRDELLFPHEMFKVICLPSGSLVCVKRPGPGKDTVLVRQDCHNKIPQTGDT